MNDSPGEPGPTGAMMSMLTKADREVLRRQLTASGHHVGDIARVFQARAGIRCRLALRWAHGMTLQDVADAWNSLDSSGRAPMTPQRVSDYERWPDAGRRPTSYVLMMFARLYRVGVDRLVDAVDYAACSDQQLFELVELTRTAATPEGTTAASTEAGEFARFVGQEIARSGGALIYPVFRLGDELIAAAAGMNQQLVYTKEVSPFTRMHRIDVPAAVAANDMRAVVYALELLQRHLRVPWRLQTDADAVRDPIRSFVSFGLSSNDATHMYLETVDRPLFEILPDGAGSEYLRLIDGYECRSTEDTKFGLVLRVRPHPDLPDRVWFFCAGLGPHGTPGAAWYLSTSWRELHRRAGDADFAAVVKVHTYSEKSAHLHHLFVASNPVRSA
jgi:hypothetical protein